DGALTIYYDALMTYVIKNLNNRLAEIAPPKVAFPVAIAGGSALPEGFFELFEKKLQEANLRIQVSKIICARDPLHAVARGCLIAAKTQEEVKKVGTVKQQQKSEDTKKISKKRK
ncbi:MAG: hypothetical protein JSW60_05415, partial [Thermoplasmatales archaeon]